MGVGSGVRNSKADPMPTEVTYMSNVISWQLGVGGTVANWKTYVLTKGAVIFLLKVIAALLK